MGCLRCCAGGWYLLSGGDGDPPDAVHVGRVSVGEFGGGEVALAVLERLPTSCKGGKAGLRPPQKPPALRWVALGSDQLLPPASLHPNSQPPGQLCKPPPPPPYCSNPQNPQTSLERLVMLPVSQHPLTSIVPPLPKPPSPGCRSHPMAPPPPPPCPATPRGPGSPPGLWAGLRSRGWIWPRTAIWKPHDAAATAHGASLRLSWGQGGRPPPPARGGGGGGLRDER